MKKLPTAKELFDKMISENDEATSTEMMIEFAKIHVKAALKAVCDYAYTKDVTFSNDVEIDEDSVLTSYPLTNIK